MPSSFVIKEIKPYDGEYEFDDRAFSTFELRWIKQISGYLPLSIQEGFEGGDADLVCALAVIAMHRAGRINREEVLAVAERLAEAPFDGSCIQFIGEEVEDDPPASTSELRESSPNGSLEKISASGVASREGSAKSAWIPEPTGPTR
jgi:hypothetical protein